MSDWTDGYRADISYTFGYYSELNPLRIKLAFLSSGLAFPNVANACELGFGQGISVNIHAAGSITKWYGTDFNPSQVVFAQELATSANTEAVLHDQSFIDFCNRHDLPDFDFIALHGIWSWVSDENQKIIVDFINRKLKVGGVLYISYNAKPSWAPFEPVRHLMKEYSDRMCRSSDGILNNVDLSLEFIEKLFAVNTAYTTIYPHIIDRIKSLKSQNKSYLAHEFFNSHWNPNHFSEMSEILKSSRLSFACSARFIDHIDSVNWTADQNIFLKGISDPVFRETVRDFIANQQFRRDYWIKGPIHLSKSETTEKLRSIKVILVNNRSDIALKIQCPLGEANMSESIYFPIFDILSNHLPVTIGQIEQSVKNNGVNLSQIVQAVMILSDSGHLSLAQEDADVQQLIKKTARFNSYIMNKAHTNGDIGHLVSPVTGGGVSVGRFQQLFLYAYKQGRKNPSDAAEYVWQVLSKQSLKVLKNGKRLATDEENLSELVQQATAFFEKKLHIFKGLQIV